MELKLSLILFKLCKYFFNFFRINNINEILYLVFLIFNFFNSLTFFLFKNDINQIFYQLIQTLKIVTIKFFNLQLFQFQKVFPVFYTNLSQIFVYFKILLYEKIENINEKNNFIDLRDSIGDLFLNIELYSLHDEQIIINVFILIEQIILNSNECSIKFFSSKTLEKICSFAEYSRQFNKDNQSIYLNFLKRFLQICSTQNKDQQIFNKLANSIIISPDPYFCDVMLNILSFHEFVAKISEKNLTQNISDSTKKNTQPKTIKTLNKSKTRINSNLKKEKEKEKVGANANKSCTKKKGSKKEGDKSGNKYQSFTQKSINMDYNSKYEKKKK